MNRPFIFLFTVLIFSLFALPGFAAENPRDHPLEGDLVEIPAGFFLFGTDERDAEGEALSLGIPKPWHIDENPQSKIFLQRFYIDRYEVSNRRYKNFVDAVGAVPPQDWVDGAYPEGKADHPVVWTNWYDAANFCDWAGKSLPTEKQWEKAARGEAGRLYPWGNEFHPEYANLPQSLKSKTALEKVGGRPKGATPLGMHDMAGNAWEWTADDYRPYKDSKYQSPDFERGYKVMRGASAMGIGHFPGAAFMKALSRFARSGYRQFADPDQGGLDTGFRCASATVTQAMKNFSAVGATANGLQDSSKSQSGKTQSGFFKKPSGNSKQASTKIEPEPFNPFQPKSNLPQSGILGLTLLAFVAGFLSFLSPCTLPILPAYFAVTAQAERKKMSLMSVAFFLGLATLFVVMGASASALGQVLRDYLFSITIAGGVLIALFGVMTLFGWGFSGANFRQKPASTFFGYYLFGAAFALGWTPCVGPVLSGILIMAASDKTILQGMNLLFFYAVGLGFPLIIISTFCGKLDRDSLFWKILRGKGWDFKIGNCVLFLHTTNLFSGLLLIALGIVLAMGYMTYINSIVPLEIQIWFSEYEEKFLNFFK